MAVKTQASVKIDCSPEEVFAVITDVALHPEWSQGAGKIQDLTDTPARLGTTWTQITRLMGKEIEAHGKVDVYEANRLFGSEVDKPFPAKMLWKVEPDGDGSMVTVGIDTNPGRFFGTVGAPILTKNIKDNFQGDLARLKAHMEKKAHVKKNS